MPQHQLYGLRGQAFTLKYRKLYNDLQKPLTNRFNELLEEEPIKRFTPKKLGQLANEFRLPLTVLSDYLEGYKLIPSGTYERLKDRGMKARDIGVVWSDD